MPDLPPLECACATVRRTARLITQLYSHEMGDHVEPGQFALLVAIEKLPGCSQAALGRALGFDKTTLSRNLKVLSRNGWIEPAEPATGHRLTKQGSKLVAETKPAWQRAQRKLKAALKSQDWDGMMKTFHAAALAASE